MTGASRDEMIIVFENCDIYCLPLFYFMNIFLITGLHRSSNCKSYLKEVIKADERC